MQILSRILIFFTILGLLTSVIIAINRAMVESNFKEVDLAIDYEAIKELAFRVGLNRVELLKRFHSEGITSLIVKEDTISSLEDVFIFSSKELKEGVYINALQDSFNPKVKDIPLIPERTYIFCEDSGLYNHLYQILNLKVPFKVYKTRISGMRLIEIQCPKEALLDIGIGFFGERLIELSRLGFDIILSLSNPYQRDPSIIDHLFKDIKKISGVKKVVFEEELIGYPGYISTTLKNINDMGLGVLVLESTPCKGIEMLATKIPNRVIRSHRITDNEMQRLKKDMAINRLLRAVRERNIRCLYLLPFLKDGGDLLNLNLDYVYELKNKLTLAGFKIGTFNTLVNIKTNNLFIFFIGLGVVSFGLLLINSMIPLSPNRILSIFGIGVSILIFGLLNRTFLQQSLAIISSTIFPALSLLILKIEERKRGIFEGIALSLKKTLLVTTISFTGALFVIGLLSENLYLLKIIDIRGIKIALFLPILVVGIFSYLKDHSLKEFLAKPIRTVHLLELGIIISLFLLLLVRSGNYESLLLPQEGSIRNLLERLLFVRPRFKEFLIGYPALILAIYLLGEGYKSVFLLMLGTISQVSLVNTYLHLHTPLVFQLIRSINGLILGILIGLVILISSFSITRIRLGAR